MLLKNIREAFLEDLGEIYEKEEIEGLFGYALKEITQLNKFILVTHPDMRLGQEETQKFLSVLSRLKTIEPIQYVFGRAEFMGLSFQLNSDTLIPRPETEELVRWVVESIKAKNQQVEQLKILEVGTGSGCIAISLAKALPNVKIMAIDISKEALRIAKENATQNGVAVDFLNQNVLDSHIQFPHKFDIIISNPPYVRQEEKMAMHDNVLCYEPEIALFVPKENPLIFYHALANLGVEWLRKQGNIFVEINQYLPTETSDIFVKKRYKEVKLKKDIFDNFRFLKATFNPNQ